jgi:dTDP-4-dehydrorhamnose 3,5-epimerase
VKFTPLGLDGVWLIELDPARDERGFFARCFDETTFAKLGMTTRFPQSSLSRSDLRGTLRGMHYSVSPSAESKLVRCVRGRIFDVVADVRRDSSTYLRWTSACLSAEDAVALFVPAGVAHGFLTLTDDTDVLYQMGDVYRPELSRGFRWNDQTFRIEWPKTQGVDVVSARDAAYSDFLA